MPLDDSDDWSAEIYEEVSQYFDGELRVVKPGKPGVFDPTTNSTTGGTADTTIMDWRPARAQHISSPLETVDGNGWATKRRFLFQCENRDGDARILKGMVVRFRGGKDASLATIAFQVTSAVNSSHAALRTIRATTEAGVPA